FRGSSIPRRGGHGGPPLEYVQRDAGALFREDSIYQFGYFLHGFFGRFATAMNPANGCRPRMVELCRQSPARLTLLVQTISQVCRKRIDPCPGSLADQMNDHF